MSLLFSDVVAFLFYGEYSIRYIIITAVVLGLWKAWQLVPFLRLRSLE